jgi:hypothetical protein
MPYEVYNLIQAGGLIGVGVGALAGLVCAAAVLVLCRA